eukprot:CAMPEP_0201480386 /NCGR_PEP_ID=MMETSP0151_2-20130828/4873_1 /ASSEMBLY_ACC=CAM_ASM_000257 /TAXON_ID=200890 /ORGANISM="Paramoeba atlantica, Strain 621/1 / CCAP 1560/9" /LENGTH=805 /DNA_ID=CAMNT_0047862217 /DNA_START=69 /DNA_END=2487 /DNA_ORIENTATION=+
MNRSRGKVGSLPRRKREGGQTPSTPRIYYYRSRLSPAGKHLDGSPQTHQTTDPPREPSQMKLEHCLNESTLPSFNPHDLNTSNQSHSNSNVNWNDPMSTSSSRIATSSRENQTNESLLRTPTQARTDTNTLQSNLTDYFSSPTKTNHPSNKGRPRRSLLENLLTPLTEFVFLILYFLSCGYFTRTPLRAMWIKRSLVVFGATLFLWWLFGGGFSSLQRAAWAEEDIAFRARVNELAREVTKLENDLFLRQDAISKSELNMILEHKESQILHNLHGAMRQMVEQSPDGLKPEKTNSEDLSQLASVVLQMSKKVDTVQKDSLKTSDRINSMNEKVTTANGRLDSVQKEVEKVTKDVNVVAQLAEGTLEQLENDPTKKKVQNVQSDLSSVKKQLDQLQSLLSDSSDTSSSHVKTAMNQLVQMEKEMSELLATVNSLQKVVDSEQGSKQLVEDLSNNLNGVFHRLETAEETDRKQASLLKEIPNRLKEMEQFDQKTQSEVADLENKLKDVHQVGRTVQADLVALRESVSAKEDLLQKVDNLSQRTEQISRLMETVQSLQDSTSHHDQSLSVLSQRLNGIEKMTSEVENLSDRITSLQSNVLSETERAEQREEIQQIIQKSTQDMKSDFETLQNDLSFLSSLVSQGDGKGDNEGALLELRKLDKKILELGQSLELMNADGTGYADWALRSAGSTVWKASPSYLSGVLDSSVDHLITAGTNIGECWPMKGTKGSAIIKLGQVIRPTAFSIDHTRMVPKDLLFSAPKEVTVSGVRSSEGGAPVFDTLAKYTYDIESPTSSKHLKQTPKKGTV